MSDYFVVVSGAPGSGKTSVAVPLARALGLPLFAKDTVKEALGDVLGAGDRSESMLLGEATMRVLIALASENRRGVIESTWTRDLARRQLGALLEPIIEVNCAVPVEVALQRYAERAGRRHPVHFDHANLGDRDAFEARAEPIAGDWPLIKLDTTQPVDIPALANRINEVARRFG